MEKSVALMPELIARPEHNILPVWDSFEAVYFVLAGIIVGFVLGFLFPSIWRTLRRRFRSHRRYLITDIPWHRTLELDLNILSLERKISVVQENKENCENYTVVQLFVMARDCVQRREYRQAVKIYGDILTSDQTRTSHIHRAFFELAQVYLFLNLFTRAFDTALELLKRIPRDEQIFKFLLLVLSKYTDEDKLYKVFRTFKGLQSDKLGKQMAHLACVYAETKLSTQSDHKKSIELARLALRIDHNFAHARFLLWQLLSKNVRNKKHLTIHEKWIAFGVDLDSWIRLCEEFNLSPHAGTQHIFALMLDLIKEDPKFECFESVRSEFNEIINFEKYYAPQQKILLESIFSVILLIRDRQTLITEQNGFMFFKKICNNYIVLQLDLTVNDIINPDILKLGILVHRCRNCQSVFERFDWSCRKCQSPESLQVCLPLFTGFAFEVSKNWISHKNDSY